VRLRAQVEGGMRPGGLCEVFYGCTDSVITLD